MNLNAPPSDYLILNSVAFIERAKPIITASHKVLLFLDNDDAGDQATSMALPWAAQVDDFRDTYAGYKDLNEWLCTIGKGRQLGDVIAPDTAL